MEPRELPKSSEYGGYLYVIGLDTGQVKVGCTSNPQTRFAAHRSTAAIGRATIANWWLSPEHENFRATEQDLIVAVRELGGVAVTREWFTGVLFEDVEKAAGALNYPEVVIGADGRPPGRAERERRWRDLVLDRVMPRHAEPEAGLMPDDRLVAAIAPLFGEMPNGDHQWPVVKSQPIPYSMVAEIALLSGQSEEETLNMDVIDMWEQSVAAIVRVHALRLRMYARENERVDLLRKLGAELTSVPAERAAT